MMNHAVRDEHVRDFICEWEAEVIADDPRASVTSHCQS
jgi:hypothetical protein